MEQQSENKLFYKAQDVAQCLSISVPTAYKVIRRLNQELENQGYFTFAGRVSRAYFEEKYGCGIRWLER